LEMIILFFMGGNLSPHIKVEIYIYLCSIMIVFRGDV